MPVPYPSPTERVHRTATCLTGAAHTALHEWSAVSGDDTLRGIAEATRAVLDRLLTGDAAGAGEALAQLDRLFVTVPRGDVTDGFRS